MSISDLIDLVGLCTVAIGGSLTLIEFYYPHIADKIEEFVDNLEHLSRDFVDNHIGKKKFDAILVLALIGSLTIGIWWIFGTISPVLSTPNLNIFVWALFFVCLSYTVFIVLLSIIGDLIDYLNRLSNGRAIGSLGLILVFIDMILGMIEATLMIFS